MKINSPQTKHLKKSLNRLTAAGDKIEDTKNNGNKGSIRNGKRS